MAYEPVTTPAATPGYPLRFDVERPEKSSRLLNGLLFIKFILAIPHLLILYALSAVVSVIVFIAFFAILFTKRYPRGLFDFAVNILRWQANVYAYIGMLRDEYPPFSWEAGKYPVTLEVDYPEQLSRFGPWYKWLLVIPNMIVLFIVLLVASVLWFVAWLAIIFTGSFPEGMFKFIVAAFRWNLRANAYASYLFRDEYPPFSTK